MAASSPLFNSQRQVEVVVRRSNLTDHDGVRAGRDKEAQKLRALGYHINYLGPHVETNWSNWYVITGSKPDGLEFYYRRWYTSNEVVSIEYEYLQDRRRLYNRVIEDMTLKRFRFW